MWDLGCVTYTHTKGIYIRDWKNMNEKVRQKWILFPKLQKHTLWKYLLMLEVSLSEPYRADGAMYICTHVHRWAHYILAHFPTMRLLLCWVWDTKWCGNWIVPKHRENWRRLGEYSSLCAKKKKKAFLFQVLTTLWGRCYSPLYRWGNLGSGN